MSSFGTGFLAEADDRFGDPLAMRVYIRAHRSDGPGQFITVTESEHVLDVAPVERKREREWGVVQGSQWEVVLTNGASTLSPGSEAWLPEDTSLVLKWAAIEVGFPDAGEWEVIAQGRILDHRIDTDGTATLVIGDPLMQLLESEIPRDMVFDDRDAWVSPVRTVDRASGSGSYSNTTGPTIIAGTPGADVVNETFRIVFANATQYDIYFEDGTTQSGGPFGIGTNHDVPSNVIGNPCFRLYASDWSGTFASGDEFVVYTSKQYSAAELNPVEIIEDLITMVGLDSSYDVVSGSPQDVRHDTAHWADVKSAFSSTKCRGYFARRTNVMDMIQGLLRVMNASLYPTNLGQLAIWHLAPEQAGSFGAVVSGDPNEPDPTILDAQRVDGDADICNDVVFEYGDLNFTAGDDGNEPAIETNFKAADDVANSPFETYIGSGVPLRLSRTVTIPWAVDGPTVEQAANRFITRFKGSVPTFFVRGTLAKMLQNEVTDAITIREPGLSANATVQVTQVAIDPIENTVELLAWVDPVLAANYARVGDAGTDPVGSQVGGSDKVF